MLDFQNENSDILEQDQDQNQNQEGSLEEILADEQISEEDAQAGDNEYLTTSVQKTNVKRGTLFLIAIFVIGGIGLFFMIKKSTPGAASAATVQSNNEIDIAIAKLSGIKAEMFQRMDNIAKKFEELSSTNQIAVDDLQRNPFKIHNVNDSIANNIKKISRRNLNTTSLELDSVMQSPDGDFCMIDGDIFYVGDYVNEYEVVEIGRNYVKLKTNSETKVLEISMP